MKEQDKISMLLDINNFYGEHEGRLGPVIKFLVIAAAPALIWIYLNFFIPVVIFAPLYAIFVIRAALIILGREKERMNEYKKQLYDIYSSSADLLNIRMVHDDGCIEYVNGTVAYAIVTANGTIYDDTARAQLIRAFMSCFGKDYNVDVYVQNITETKSLEDRYKGVKLFTDAEAAKDFIEIIDHNRQITCANSLLTRVIFVVKGRKSDWKEIKYNIQTAIYSSAAKAFKDVHLATHEEVNELVNRDVNGVVNIDEILEKKYATHEYFQSKVLYYDTPQEPESPKASRGVGEEIGFMVSMD